MKVEGGMGKQKMRDCWVDDVRGFAIYLNNGLEELIQQKQKSSDYIYLLHCYIGICDSKTILKSIYYLEELIVLKYEECAFLYLVELANQYIENDANIILHLSNKHIMYLLDACQKTCLFNTSLSILRIVRSELNYDKQFDLYYAKVMTQCYDFETALNEVNKLPESNETILYKLIIFEHLGKDEEAKKLLDKLKNKEKIIYDKWYYIILRNSWLLICFQLFQHVFEHLKHIFLCQDLLIRQNKVVLQIELIVKVLLGLVERLNMQ